MVAIKISRKNVRKYLHVSTSRQETVNPTDSPSKIYPSNPKSEIVKSNYLPPQPEIEI
jgi:hypothetical protein